MIHGTLLYAVYTKRLGAKIREVNTIVDLNTSGDHKEVERRRLQASRHFVPPPFRTQAFRTLSVSNLDPYSDLTLTVTHNSITNT